MKVAIHDLERIEKIKRIKMLRSLLKDCKQVKKEAERVKQFLDSKRTSDPQGSSGIVSKVKSLIENPSDLTTFEQLQT